METTLLAIRSRVAAHVGLVSTAAAWRVRWAACGGSPGNGTRGGRWDMPRGGRADSGGERPGTTAGGTRSVLPGAADCGAAVRRFSGAQAASRRTLSRRGNRMGSAGLPREIQLFRRPNVVQAPYRHGMRSAGDALGFLRGFREDLAHGGDEGIERRLALGLRRLDEQALRHQQRE